MAYAIDIVLAGIAASGFALLVVVPLALSGRQDDPAANLILQTVLFLVFAGYFILAWRQRRATLGQLMLGLVVGNEADGSKLTWGAAFIRWLALTLGPLPALLALVTPADLGALGTMLQLVWFIVLLVTTATSPTMQGLHDRWAHSLVVRRA